MRLLEVEPVSSATLPGDVPARVHPEQLAQILELLRATA